MANECAEYDVVIGGDDSSNQSLGDVEWDSTLQVETPGWKV